MSIKENTSPSLSVFQGDAEATPADSPRILVSRLSAIGDAILTMPVVCCIRDAFPNAFIGWAVESKVVPVVQHHRALDTVIELRPGWYRSPTSLAETRKHLRDLRFDLTIDCQGTLRSSLACYLSGASRRIGFHGKHLWDLGGVLNNEKVSPVFHHQTDRALELLTPLGIHHPKVKWELPIEKSDLKWASDFRSKIKSPRVAILNPGGAWASNLWEPDRFASTARYLADRYGYHSLVVWGTFNERLMAERIVELSEGTVSLAPDTSLKTLAALIKTADLFISGDTGPLHMSVAVGTKTIGLYGATRPGDSGPYGQVALQLQYESGSRRHRRAADNRAMRAIGVEHVCAVVDEMHAKKRVARAA
ncbi:heptosyltransferase-1 [Neorhodopirellula lusitana]|uniref:Heptosyltransferase-1 n=1 Tax=Neorhodopirellula lusitana TaxID=445327 RepID=A0ABY1PVZ0_9BACT|nr:glycosyltransferase family 9 protein [Neorhodopirellula lusitana]SMP48866.1 heptosyltransferase-1 [Neorhodopirellula lusitana]